MANSPKRGLNSRQHTENHCVKLKLGKWLAILLWIENASCRSWHFFGPRKSWELLWLASMLNVPCKFGSGRAQLFLPCMFWDVWLALECRGWRRWWRSIRPILRDSTVCSQNSYRNIPRAPFWAAHSLRGCSKRIDAIFNVTVQLSLNLIVTGCSS